MAIFKFLKKEKKKKEFSKEEKKEEKKLEKEEKKKEFPIKEERKTKIAPLVLKAPHITEKATDLLKKNQYVFKVFPGASKGKIKRAIEEVYGVKVLKVRIVKTPKKRRRVGRTFGWKKGYKKAIVKIKEGQKIELMPK